MSDRVELLRRAIRLFNEKNAVEKAWLKAALPDRARLQPELDEARARAAQAIEAYERWCPEAEAVTHDG